MIDVIFGIAILIMSVVVHEVAHAYTAVLLGDPTPRLQGRLTLNPLKHLDFLGSLIVPLFTYMAGMAFGWAKPVLINPYNLRHGKWGELYVALAGPASNIIIAVFFALVIRLSLYYEVLVFIPFIQITSLIIFVNIVLAVFNLIPVPPLDGSKILFVLIPAKHSYIREILERYSLIFIILVLFVFWRLIQPIIPFIYKILLGV